MRRLASLLLIGVATLTFTFLRVDAAPQSKPTKEHSVCFSVDEAAKIDVRLIELERDLKIARARNRRFGGVVGCGVGLGWQVEDGSATLDATPFCGAVWGIRF